MKSKLFRIENPANSPLYFRGGGVDVFYVLSRNADVSDLFGEHKQGYIFIDEVPNKSILKNIKFIKFKSGRGDDVIDKLPDWLYDINHIYALSVPIDVFLNEKFTSSTILPSLEVLEITHSNDTQNIIDINCANFMNAKRLIIMAYNYRLTNCNIPKNIETLSINLDGKVKDELSNIEFLPKVKILQLESLSTKLDLSPLSELKLTGLSVRFNSHKKQSLLSLIDMSELEYLFINNIAMPIDFSVFSDANSLKEITIMNSKKFENICAIKNIQTLRCLELSYCTLKLTEEEKAIINKIDLELLTIR